MVVCMKDVMEMSLHVFHHFPAKINDTSNEVIKVVKPYYLEVIKISRNW